MVVLTLTVVFFLLTAFEICFTGAFRTDYTYIESTHSYYKHQSQEATWTDARATCQAEGALLFHPEDKTELEQVLSVLGLRYSFIFTGISDLHNRKEYTTVDGRPVSQVYNVWDYEEPYYGSADQYLCGRLHVINLLLDSSECSATRRYICKHHETTLYDVATAIGQVKTILANPSDRIATALEQQTAHQTAVSEVYERAVAANQSSVLARLAKVIANQAVSQTSALERLAVALDGQKDALQLQITNQAAAVDKHSDAIQRLAASQTSALERLAAALVDQKDSMQQQAENQAAAINQQTEIMEQAANQTSVLERLVASQTSALDRLAAALVAQKDAKQQQAAKQTAALEQQAVAMENLANLQEDNRQLDNRQTGK